MQGLKQVSRKVEIKDKQPKACLVEIFSSFQGEGIFVGTKQIFIRFAGCNLNCSFCDTSKGAVIKDATVAQVVGKVKDLEKDFGRHHSVSLTGGEPLLHVSFLERLLPELKKENLKIYLETNGTLGEELKRIIEYIDIVAMDIKLPSSANINPLWNEHIEFLKVAIKKEVFVKVVVNNNTLESDVVKARDIVARFNKDIPFILQPASIDEKGNFKVTKAKLLDYLNLAEEKLSNTRIIPQVHKFLGIK